MFEVIAERELTSENDGARRVTVQLAKPVRQKTGEWSCSFRIVGLDETARHAYGEDSLQSLQMALEAVRLMLKEHARSFFWLGDSALGAGLTRAIPIVLPPDSISRIETAIDNETAAWAAQNGIT